MHTLTASVADRYLIRLAAQQALSTHRPRTRTANDARLMQATLVSLGETFYLPQHRGKVAFFGLAKKLGQITSAFKKLPDLWEKFKKVVGIESLSDIPAALKRLWEAGKKALHGVIDKMFSKWPLKLYTLEKGKLSGFNDILDKMISQSPKLKAFLSKATQKIGDFGEMLRQYAPHLIGAAMLAAYIYIWLNVAEFEWDLKSLTDAIAGRLDFPSFLASLPGSAFGLLISSVSNVGTFTLLPYTIAARILFLIGSRYLSWNGTWFSFDWKALNEDFGVQPPKGVKV